MINVVLSFECSGADLVEAEAVDDLQLDQLHGQLDQLLVDLLLLALLAGGAVLAAGVGERGEVVDAVLALHGLGEGRGHGLVGGAHGGGCHHGDGGHDVTEVTKSALPRGLTLRFLSCIDAPNILAGLQIC